MTKESDTESRSIIKSSSHFGITTLISRISGFVRDILFANYFGASSSTDAFFVAFKIPNFFRRLFAEGAFSQAFVPVLQEYRLNKSHLLSEFIQNILGNLFVVLLVITILGMYFSTELRSPFLSKCAQYIDNHVCLYSLQFNVFFFFIISLIKLKS